MSKKTYNLTTNFALPLLGWIRSVYEPYLINAYIKHAEVEHFQEDHIFLLFKESIDERYKKLETKMVEHPCHVSHYFLDKTEEYCMQVFKFVPMVQPDYQAFLDGKYSKMSEGACKLIEQSSKKGTNLQILNRSSALKKYQEERIGVELGEEDEVWSCIMDPNNINNEVFTNELFEKIKSSLN